MICSDSQEQFITPILDYLLRTSVSFVSSHIPRKRKHQIFTASSKSATMQTSRIFVFISFIVARYRTTDAYCSSNPSSKVFGNTLKCWNATLKDMWKTGGPMVAEISIRNSKIDTVSAYAFSNYTKSLQSLSLTDCQVSQINAYAFNDLKLLKKLNLANNKITTTQQLWFADLISLEELDMSFNNIGAIDEAVFARLSNLRLLNLNNNQLQCLEPRGMEPMRSIVKMYVTANPLTLLCRARMTRWFNDKGIKYLHDLDANSGSWLDRVLWLCAEDVPVKTETQMRECVLLHIFNQLGLALKTTDSYHNSAQQCRPERQSFMNCLRSSGTGPVTLTNGEMVMKMIVALRGARQQLQKSSKLPRDD